MDQILKVSSNSHRRLLNRMFATKIFLHYSKQYFEPKLVAACTFKENCSYSTINLSQIGSGSSSQFSPAIPWIVIDYKKIF